MSRTAEYRRRYPEKAREQQARYARSEKGKATRRRADAKQDPAKHAARIALNRAVQRGEVTRLPCRCGETRVEAHHPRGYDDPLDVEWWCHRYHRVIHGRLTIIQPSQEWMEKHQ